MVSETWSEKCKDNFSLSLLNEYWALTPFMSLYKKEIKPVTMVMATKYDTTIGF